MTSRLYTKLESLIVAIYRFTVSCIDQRVFTSLHSGIFGVLSDVWSVCTI